MQRDRPESVRRRAALWCGAVIITAAMLRVWLSWYDHSVFWPDEIHQSLEQAHRAVFGYGLLSWEFRDGARSWFFPGAIAALWQGASALGVDSSLTFVMLARLLMVACSVVAIGFAAKLAADTQGTRAGLASAVILATFPPAVVFSYRGMSETASAPLIAVGAWLLSRRSERSALYAGLFMALACLCRYQNGLFVLVFVATLLLQRRWREGLAFCGAGAGVALVGGLLDWATWGRPFHSLITYIDFNLLRDGASTFGVEPFSFYASVLWSSTGPLIVPLAVCFLVGAAREPVLGGAVLAFVLAHCVLPHKEFRFLVPCLPLFATVAGIGVDAIARRAPKPRLTAALSAAALSAAFAFGLVHLEYGDLGQYKGTERSSRSVWKSEEEPTLLLADAGTKTDLCGVTVLGARAAFTGGYTYLHRDVPLIYESRLCSTAPANYIITRIARAASVLPRSYQLAEQRGGWGLYRRDGICHPAKNYDRLLEGAQDMGLVLRRAEQAPDGSLRFDLARDGGSFSHGWGHGERIDCDPARWAMGKQASIEFDFEPRGPRYQLNLHVRAHERTIRQRFAVAINGVSAHVGPLPRRMKRFAIDLPERALRSGPNRLELAFSHAVRASANDERELAALFRSIEIIPKRDDFLIDVALAESRRHLVSGFHASEQAGATTFVWSDGPASEVEGSLAWPNTPYLLEILAEALPLVPSQKTRIYANDVFVGTLNIPRTWARRRLAIPAHLLGKPRDRIRFEYESTLRPADANPELRDTRQLAVRFRRIELSPLPPRRDLDFGTTSARPYLLEGWSGDERDAERSAVWSDGERASALLSFGATSKPVLRLTARGYGRALPVSVDVTVDGANVGSFAAPEGWQTLGIALPEGDYSGGGKVVSFQFDRTARASDSDPNNQDHRQLALRVDRLWVESEETSQKVDTTLRTLRASAR